AKAADDPAFALFIFYPQAGLVEVLPQPWVTASQYEIGRQWITRAARDPESHRILGECFGVGQLSAGRGWMPVAALAREERCLMRSYVQSITVRAIELEI